MVRLREGRPKTWGSSVGTWGSFSGEKGEQDVKLATHPIYDRIRMRGALPPLHGVVLKIGQEKLQLSLSLLTNRWSQAFYMDR
jgi:hypothetical protein